MVVIYFDDIEKFGIWLEIFDWVYNCGWFKVLIEGVLVSFKICIVIYVDFYV